MWYRVRTASNYNLNKLSMEGGRGLESSFINPLKLCSQCFKNVYVLLWIAIMVTNASVQRVCLSSRQCFTRTIQSNNPHIFKIKWMRKMKCKTLDKDKPCNKSHLRFSYCVLWLCCLMKQTFLVLSIPFCAVMWWFNSSYAEWKGKKAGGKACWQNTGPSQGYIFRRSNREDTNP